MVTGSDATMNWSAPKSDGGQPLQSYLIEKKETKSPNWDKVGEVSTSLALSCLLSNVVHKRIVPFYH